MLIICQLKLLLYIWGMINKINIKTMKTIFTSKLSDFLIMDIIIKLALVTLFTFFALGMFTILYATLTGQVNPAHASFGIY